MNKDADKIAETIRKMANDRARLEHVVRTVMSRLDAEESEIDICLIESKQGSFAWINKYLPVSDPDHT